jgi:hypothetical protein
MPQILSAPHPRSQIADPRCPQPAAVRLHRRQVERVRASMLLIPEV